MKRDLSENLNRTRDLLAGSLQMRSGDQATPMPDELYEDLALRFNRISTEEPAAPTAFWFEKLQKFIARPAFGVAAFAMVIVALALPGMMNSTPPGSGFRGAVTYSSGEAVRIILINAPSAVLRSLESSGDFESGAFASMGKIDETLEGARVLVNFDTSEITVVDVNGDTVFTDSLPEDQDALSPAIASAVSRL